MKPSETIFPGEKITIENTHSAALSLQFESSNGCLLDLDLLPGQVLGFAAGDVEAKVILLNGDPAGLLLIRPESAS